MTSEPQKDRGTAYLVGLTHLYRLKRSAVGAFLTRRVPLEAERCGSVGAVYRYHDCRLHRSVGARGTARRDYPLLFERIVSGSIVRWKDRFSRSCRKGSLESFRTQWNSQYIRVVLDSWSLVLGF